MVPEIFSRMHVGHVHLDHGDFQYGEGIGNGMAVMRPGSGIDDDGLYVLIRSLVDALHHDAFVIGLKTFHRSAKFLAQSRQGVIYQGQGGAAVGAGSRLSKMLSLTT